MMPETKTTAYSVGPIAVSAKDQPATAFQSLNVFSNLLNLKSEEKPLRRDGTAKSKQHDNAIE